MMTSECFVYITLPGQTTPVTAGKLAVSIDRHGTHVGRFVYGRSYRGRADAVPIDPVELKLDSRLHETTAMGGMFGALRDASPDYWGRRVIQRQLRTASLDELDYLLHSPDDRAGALGFGLYAQPPAPLRSFNRTLDLATLQDLADAVVADRDLPDSQDNGQVAELLLLGTSMGGARGRAARCRSGESGA